MSYNNLKYDCAKLLLFDLLNLLLKSEKEFDEKVEYEDYQAFADSMTGDEVVNQLNGLDGTIKDLSDDYQRLMEENKELKQENEELKQKNKKWIKYVHQLEIALKKKGD